MEILIKDKKLDRLTEFLTLITNNIIELKPITLLNSSEISDI